MTDWNIAQTNKDNKHILIYPWLKTLFKAERIKNQNNPFRGRKLLNKEFKKAYKELKLKILQLGRMIRLIFLLFQIGLTITKTWFLPK